VPGSAVCLVARVKVGDAAIGFRKRSVNVITKAIVERQPRPHFPAVLSVEARLPRAIVGSKQISVTAFCSKRANQESG